MLLAMLFGGANNWIYLTIRLSIRNSTISKSCVQRKNKDWLLHDEKTDFDHMYIHTKNGLTDFDNVYRKYALSCSESSKKPAKDFISRPDHKSDQQVMFANGIKIKHLPSFLSACCEVKWFINSRRTLSQVINSVFKQVCSLSAVLLVCATLLLLSIQVASLLFMLSFAASLPYGLLFMFCSVCFISMIAFKTMRFR